MSETELDRHFVLKMLLFRLQQFLFVLVLRLVLVLPLFFSYFADVTLRIASNDSSG